MLRRGLLMPLLDHFRPPIFNQGSWEGFHGMWPALMVMDLCRSLPEQYTAEPRVQLGKNFEVDVCTFDTNEERAFVSSSPGSSNSGVATATWAPPEPTLALDLDLTENYAYEVLIFDQQRGRELVVGTSLPVLPIWLDNDHAISLNLKDCYQQTCKTLRLI